MHSHEEGINVNTYHLTFNIHMNNFLVQKNESIDNNLWVDIRTEILLYIYGISFYLELEDEVDFSDEEDEIPLCNDLRVVVEISIGEVNTSSTAMAHQGFREWVEM